MTTICDSGRPEREQVGGILVQRMKKRGESLQIACFERGEDLTEQYESEGQYPGYDLAFMDIYLQRLNGMETIRRLRKHDRNAAMIFMSSSPDYAIESCDVRADSYLLKPTVRDKVENVLNRSMGYRYLKDKKSLLTVNGSSSRRISYNDIMYVESRRMNLRIVRARGVEHAIRRRLDEVQAKLTQPRLLECNQSYIVNMDYITHADTDFTMEDGDRIPIKVRERKRIRERYSAYMLERGWNDI